MENAAFFPKILHKIINKKIKRMTKMENICDTLDIRAYGASPMGDTDCSDAIYKALNDISGGGKIYFPKGTYLIEKPIIIDKSHLVVCGDGRQSKIIYNYAQKDGDSSRKVSLFTFADEVSDITVKDMLLEYNGHFFDEVAQSYFGRVSGVSFGICDDVLIRNIEVRGFNASGVEFIGCKERYSNRATVTECYIHHNRVAGVLYGYIDGISITNNTLEHQGSKKDGGTGYGCTGFSGATPRNIQIIGNRCSFNSRKGIDLHAGMYAIISGNICEGNGLYGIYAEGSRTNNIVITGNIIRDMTLIDTPYLPIYSWIEGIGFGTASEAPNAQYERNFLIAENEIYNFSFENGRAFPFNCYYAQHCGNIMIKNNIVQAGKITHAVGFGGKGAHTEKCKNAIQVTGNRISCQTCTSFPFIFSSFESLDLSHNSFTAKETVSVFTGVAGDDSGAMISAHNIIKYDSLTDAEDPNEFKLLGIKDETVHFPKIIEKNIVNGNIIP